MFQNISGAAKILTTLIQDATSSIKGILQLTGDLGGSAASPSVSKVNGSSVPAGGSLTTGNVLQVSGSSALSYAAVNLAGGANFVTGTLPTGNQAAQSLGGDLTGTTASATVATLTGSSNTVTVPAATNVSYGSVPASAGQIRLSNNSSIKCRDVTNAVDLNLVSGDTGNNIDLGSAAGNTSRVRCTSGGTIEFNINASDFAKVTQTGMFFNNTASPATPTGGGQLFASSGAGKWIGSGGTTTTFGPAEPHCPRCGRDYALEWENEANNEHLAICMACLVGALAKAGIGPEQFTITNKMKT